jgi:hypothetical protein
MHAETAIIPLPLCPLAAGFIYRQLLFLGISHFASAMNGCSAHN